MISQWYSPKNFPFGVLNVRPTKTPCQEGEIANILVKNARRKVIILLL